MLADVKRTDADSRAYHPQMLSGHVRGRSDDKLSGRRNKGLRLPTVRQKRLLPFQKLAEMLLFDGILNYCRTKVALGVVEAINGNIKTLLRRGRGYRNLRYLLLKAQRLAATKIDFVAFEKAA